MRALVEASAKIGFGAPYELNRRELVPFRHDRRNVSEFELLILACFKELLGAKSEMDGRRCGFYFAGAKDTLTCLVEIDNHLADRQDKTAALAEFFEDINPLTALDWLLNTGLYLAAKENVDCTRHCQYISHPNSDHNAVAAAVRDVSTGVVDVGFAVGACAGGGFELPIEQVGGVGVRIVAGGGEVDDVFELSSRSHPELLLDMASAHSAMAPGSALAIELPVHKSAGS